MSEDMFLDSEFVVENKPVENPLKIIKNINNTKIVLFSKSYLGDFTENPDIDGYNYFFNSLVQTEILPAYIFFIRDSVKILGKLDENLKKRINYFKKMNVIVGCESQSMEKYDINCDLIEKMDLSDILVTVMDKTEIFNL